MSPDQLKELYRIHEEHLRRSRCVGRQRTLRLRHPYGLTMIRREALFWNGLIALAVLVIAAVAIWEMVADGERDRFFAKCIEFHDYDRCADFWNLGRLDLGEK